MYKVIALASLLALTACNRDDSISIFVVPNATYQLVELDGVASSADITITFPEAGQVVGQGPCNSYTATQTVPYPWFAIEGIAATRMACPDLALEAAYFAALEDMTLAEVFGDKLTLTNSAGREMVFLAP